MNHPFLLEAIEEILETALFTASVRDAIPVSLILVGDSGVAKSKLLMRLKSESILMTDSFTSQGLFDITQNDKKNTLRFLITPDLNPTLSRRPAVLQSTIANLLSLTADGTCRIDDGRREKVAEHAPIGLITACTPQIYARQAKRWFALGLRRRIIPVFYTYTPETVDKLMEMARSGKINGANFSSRSIVFPPASFPNIPDSLSRTLEVKARDFAINLGKLSFTDDVKIKRWAVAKVIPISPLVTLQTLARAHAIRAKRGTVNEEDMEFCSRFIAFTDPETPRQI